MLLIMLKCTLLCISTVFVCYSGVQSASELTVSPTAFEDLGKPFYEFTCEAHLEKNHWVSWYQEKPKKKEKCLKTLKTQGNVKFDLLLPLDESDRDSVIYCITHDEYDKREFKEISKGKDIRINFQKDKYPFTASELTVSPTAFEDLGKPFYEFTCEAHLEKNHWVSWYQEKPKKKEKCLKTLKTQGNVKFDLLLPLDESDRDSVIYCITHDEYDKREFKEISKGKDIRINFQKDKYPFKKLQTPQVMPETFDDSGEPIAEFTCWGYLNGWPKLQPRLSWYQVKGDKKPVLFNKTYLQTYYGYEKVLFRKTLEPPDIGSHIYCVHEILKEGSYVEEASSTEIQFTISRDQTDIWGPRIDPITFSEDGNSLTVNNNCSAYLYKGELLTWFQIKGSNTPTRLAMIQQKQEYGKIEIKLRKTLDLSDKDTDIYCVRETVDENVTFKIKGEKRGSRIEFQKHIETSEKPYVKVDPSSGFKILEEGEKLDLYCTGSKPVDNRTYGWHIQGPKIHQLSASSATQYEDDSKEKVHVQKLYMKQFYHMNKLYCAQAYEMELQLSDSEKIFYYYGEVARSDYITLLLQGYEGSNDKPMVSFVNSTERESRTFINTRPKEYTCCAFVKPYHVVSWYQTTGTGSQPSSEDILLKTFQYAKHTDRGKWMNFNLKKTLVNSDNGTKLYCATQRVLPDGIYSNTVDQPMSELIPLMFQKNLTSLETPQVTVEPSSDVIIFDQYKKLELVCGGTKPVDGRKYTWYLQDSKQIIHDFSYNFKKSTSQDLRNHFNQTMEISYHMGKLYCAQDYTINLKAPKYRYSKYYEKDVTKMYGELARSNNITLLLRTQGDPKDKPQVTPSYFEDQRKSFIVFTCYAFMLPWEVLSWYQYKGSYVTKQTLIRTVQLQDTTYEKGQWMILTLNKTLEPSDRNSNIYCAKQTVLPGGNYSKASDNMISQTITLTFQRDISPLNALITIKPDSNVQFEVNTTQRFTCSGSKPIDGRNYTWLIMDRNSNLTMPASQSYDQLTNENVLELFLDDNFHQSRLFCAQVFLSNIKDKNEIAHRQFYGEIFKTEISLKRGGKYAENEATSSFSSNGSQKTILAITIPALLALLVGLVYWKLRRRRYKAVHDATTTPSPTETPKPKPAEHPSSATRQYPSEPNGATTIPTGSSNTPKPAGRPKPAPRPDLTLLVSTKTSKTRPTLAVKPVIAGHPNPFVTASKTLAPTETPAPTGTPMSTVTPETLTPVPKEQGDSNASYGNFVKLFTDMDSNQVTYACLDLPKNNSAQTSASTNIRGAPKTYASADNNRTKASATTLALSESSPYAQIIGVYTPPNQ